VIDGYEQPAEELSEILGPEDRFLGLSCTSLSYGRALPLIEQAGERGIPVFVGGVHSRVMGRNIVRNRPRAIVVSGPGEYVLGDFLDGTPVEELEGVWTAAGGRRPTRRGVPYEFKPFLHETTDYSGRFSTWGGPGHRIYGDVTSEVRVAVRGLMGCSKPSVCFFCSAPRIKAYDVDSRARYMIEERRSIVESFGEDTYILDCSDCMPGKETLELMASEVGSDMGRTRVHCGAMVWELADDEWRRLARGAGYTDYLIGLEGYSPRFLHITSKPADSVEQCVDLLRRTLGTDLRFMISGIVGWPGECEESLCEARETILRLLEFQNVACVSVNCLVPLPGSPVYTQLMKDGAVDEHEDAPDLQELFRQHVERSCPETSVARLMDFIASMREVDSRVIQVMGFADN
jgi:radical SAM superfamily enzyme YgiQ (UPF0313 family)